MVRAAQEAREIGSAFRTSDIPLMPGARYTMTFSIDDFWTDIGESDKVVANDKIKAVYEVAAFIPDGSPASEAAIPNMPIWKGKVESAAVPYTE